MAQVRPFRGIRYNPAVAGPLDQLLAPPYDVVSPALQEELHRRSPYNVLRLELGLPTPVDSPQDNPYTRAAACLTLWRRQGVLVQETRPALYLTVHRFTHGGLSYHRRELTVALRLEELGGGVRPHERTAPGPKADRLALMRATRATISPIMLLYKEATGRLEGLLTEIEGGPPAARAASFQAESLALWVVEDPEVARAVRSALAEQPLYIADGHHRYETALEYRREARAAGVPSEDGAADYVLASLLDISDPGLLCLPYHRLLTGLPRQARQGLRPSLERLFSPTSLPLPPGDAEEVAQLCARNMASSPGIIMGVLGLEPGHLLLLSVRDTAAFEKAMPLDRSAAWQSLAPCIFGEVLLPAVLGLTQPQAEAQGYLDYTPDTAEAARRISNGTAEVGFLLTGVPLGALKAVADAGERLPRKSTYFHPKLATGLVMKSLEGQL